MDTRNVHVERLDAERFMLMPLSTATPTSVKWHHQEGCRILSDEAVCTCVGGVASGR